MADMFDPSVAEQIARLTSDIASNATKISRTMANANRYATQLQNKMTALVGSTAGVANAAQRLASGLNTAAGGARNVTNQLRQTNQVQQQVNAGVQRQVKQMSMLEALGKVLAGKVYYDQLLSLKTLQSAGFAPLQTMALDLQATQTAISLSMQGYVTSAGDAAQIIASLSKNLGGTTMYSQQLLEQTVKMKTAWGVNAEVGGKVSSMLLRWNDGSEQQVVNTENWVAALAKANGVAPGAIMAEMANNSEVLARYGAQGAQNFAKMAIELARAGTTMKEMSGFGDKLVGDFESTLTSTAKLQTFLPGLDMSGVMMASQFGTEKDIQSELTGALKNAGLKDISQLPRSLQNMLSSSLGLSKETIENLLHPQTGKSNEVRAPTAKDMDESSDKIVTAIKWVVGTLIAAGIGKMSFNRLFAGGAGGGGLRLAARAQLARTSLSNTYANLVTPRSMMPFGNPLGPNALSTGTKIGAVGEKIFDGIKTFGSTVFKLRNILGGVASIGGIVLSTVGQKIKDRGDKKLGASVSVLGAATAGVGIGAMFAGVGAPIGAAVGALVGVIMNAKELLFPAFRWIGGVFTNLANVISKYVSPILRGFSDMVVNIIDWIGKKIPNVVKSMWSTIKGWGDVAETSTDAAQANEALTRSIGMVQDKFSDVGGQNFGYAKQLYEDAGRTVGVPSGANVKTIPVTSAANKIEVAETTSSSTTTSTNTNMSELLQAVRELTSAYRATKWDVNLDGKKVGAGIMAANRV